jgi:hypothetical protein
MAGSSQYELHAVEFLCLACKKARPVLMELELQVTKKPAVREALPDTSFEDEEARMDPLLSEINKPHKKLAEKDILQLELTRFSKRRSL